MARLLKITKVINSCKECLFLTTTFDKRTIYLCNHDNADKRFVDWVYLNEIRQDEINNFPKICPLNNYKYTK